MRYVILGGSIAGLSAARAIREQDRTSEIVLVSTEQGPAYYRPLIPFLIDGSKKVDDLVLTENLHQQLGLNVSYRTAEQVDTAARTVFLSGKKNLAYDRLLIATGARPIIPAIPGIDPDSMQVLRTMADALKLGKTATGARHMVVIGGGMVGIKAATALRNLNRAPEVTIIEKEDHLLPLRLDGHGADMIAEALSREGIGIFTGTTVAEVITQKKTTGLKLADGTTLQADLVIAAVGVSPNIEFLAGSEITVKDGVVVDERLETSAKDVYAAGDAAEYRDLVTGTFFVSGLWTNAVEMGRLAGLNMAGANASSDGFLPVMNAAEIAGIPLISAGIVEPDAGFEVVRTVQNGSYRKVLLKDDRIVGISFVGDVKNAGVYVTMIRNRIPIKRAKERFLRGAATHADVAVMG